MCLRHHGSRTKRHRKNMLSAKFPLVYFKVLQGVVDVLHVDVLHVDVLHVYAMHLCACALVSK